MIFLPTLVVVLPARPPARTLTFTFSLASLISADIHYTIAKLCCNITYCSLYCCKPRPRIPRLILSRLNCEFSLKWCNGPAFRTVHNRSIAACPSVCQNVFEKFTESNNQQSDQNKSIDSSFIRLLDRCCKQVSSTTSSINSLTQH